MGQFLFILTRAMTYIVKATTYSHPAQVKLYLDYLTDKDPDIFLISQDGEQVPTHRILLRLFSTVFTDLITQSEPVSHMSVPASGSVLKHLLNAITTGVAVTTDKEELNRVAEVAKELGLSFIDWQVGLARKKTKKTETMKRESESLNGFTFETGNDEQKHKRDLVKLEVTPDINVKEIATETDDGQLIFGCDVCEKKYPSKRNLRRHKRLLHGVASNVKIEDRFKCNLCDKTFTTKKYGRRHIRDIHEVGVKKESKAACLECKKVHGLNPKDDKHHECTLCNNKVYGMKNYQQHRNARHGLKARPVAVKEPYDEKDPNHCHECKEAYESKTDLIVHQDTKHIEGNPDFLTCRFCEKKISRKQKGWFMEHLRKHTGDSPEVCSYCGQSFKQKKALKNHERLHTGEKPYKCEFCFAAFTQQNGLSSHQKSRSGCQMELA